MTGISNEKKKKAKRIGIPLGECTLIGAYVRLVALLNDHRSFATQLAPSIIK